MGITMWMIGGLFTCGLLGDNAPWHLALTWPFLLGEEVRRSRLLRKNDDTETSEERSEP